MFSSVMPHPALLFSFRKSSGVDADCSKTCDIPSIYNDETNIIFLTRFLYLGIYFSNWEQASENLYIEFETERSRLTNKYSVSSKTKPCHETILSERTRIKIRASDS